MAGAFQKIVLTVAIVIFIILLMFIGSVLYQNKYSAAFPPVISSCPDYWIDRSSQITNPNDASQSTTYGTCYNVKNLGNPSCSKEMNFNGSAWSGSDGECRKYKWAKGCDLTWDGITNNTNICNTSSSSSS
jgi:hypothetical protein